MISYRHLLNLRQIAVHNVMTDDVEFYIEKCLRYYSKTYHTPLHIVKELIPLEEVIMICMEDEMQDFTADEISDWKKKVDETPKAYVAAPEFMEQEEMSEDLWIAQQTALLKKQDEKQKKQKEQTSKEIETKTNQAIDKLTASINAITIKAIPQGKK